MIKAVIFDMDGLMIDSERVTFEGYQAMLLKQNLTMSEEFYKTLLGKTLTGIYEQFYKEYGEGFDIESLIKEVHSYMANRFETQGIPVKPGLLKLLQYLKENQYKTIVATSSQRYRVDTILSLANLTIYFDDSICGDEVTKGKPNPEVFIKSCQKLGVTTDEAIVLEDSEAGIEAAYHANIDVFCVPDMKYPEVEYQKMTTKIVNSLFDVLTYLQENNK